MNIKLKSFVPASFEMGGKAFTSGPNPVNVIRISHERYCELQDRYQRLLLDFYSAAFVPPEAPGKPDHGDIDILVVKSLQKLNIIDLGAALGAHEQCRSGPISSFAIPFGDTTDDETFPVDGTKKECVQASESANLQIPAQNDNAMKPNFSKQNSGPEYFQLDVQLCTPENFEWEKLIQSYGDLWQILGSAVNRFGLSINNTGLHIRVAEIEATSKKASLLQLTSQPQAMMGFLGLSHARYDEGFQTLDEAFSWLTACRFFKRKFFEWDKVSDKEQKARDKRSMYAKFVTTWLPQHHQHEDEIHNLERASVLNEALDTFRKCKEYESMLEAHRKRCLKGRA